MVGWGLAGARGVALQLLILDSRAPSALGPWEPEAGRGAHVHSRSELWGEELSLQKD